MYISTGTAVLMYSSSYCWFLVIVSHQDATRFGIILHQASIYEAPCACCVAQLPSESYAVEVHQVGVLGSE
jgi:hypothetical protein